MKELFTNFIKRFLANPVYPALTILLCCIMFFVNAQLKKPPETTVTDSHRIEAIRYANSTTTSTTATTSTTKTTTKITTTTITTTMTTSETTTEADEENSDSTETTPIYNYISAGDSPNSSFYQDRLVVVGDSIAYGYNAYGYIPYQHSISAESLAVWNMHNYTFDLGGGAMGIYDAVSYAYSPLYMISVGMNDIYSYTADDLGWKIREIAEEILARVPTATIVVAGITPVSDGNYYTTNDRIREYNSSIEWIIGDMQSSPVLYFNTHDVLCDWNTGALGWDYAGGDGLHLNSSAYSAMLHCLFNYLDDTSAYEQILAHEGG